MRYRISFKQTVSLPSPVGPSEVIVCLFSIYFKQACQVWQVGCFLKGGGGGATDDKASCEVRPPRSSIRSLTSLNRANFSQLTKAV